MKRQPLWQAEPAASHLTLRIGIEARLSRTDENEKRISKDELAAQSRMGCASGMADALRCLEFDVARYQDRIARSTANFLCGYPFSRCNHRPFCRVRRASELVTAAPFRLFAPGFYWGSDVCGQLRSAFLGRVACLLRFGSGVAGDHSDLRHAFRACNATRRAIATAQTSGRTSRAGRC